MPMMHAWIEQVKSCPSFPSVIQRREVARMLERLGPAAKVINVGSKNTRFASNVLNLDLVDGPGVDVVADVHALPFEDHSVDGVIVIAVLEIVKDPQKAVAEILRVLKKDGIVLATLPFMQPYHPDPTDCQRFTREGVQHLFKDFETVQLGNNRGLCSMFSWVLRDFLAIFLSFNNLTLWKAWNIILGWLLYPINYLDYVLPDYSQLHFVSSSFLYIGRKRG